MDSRSFRSYVLASWSVKTSFSSAFAQVRREPHAADDEHSSPGRAAAAIGAGELANPLGHCVGTAPRGCSPDPYPESSGGLSISSRSLRYDPNNDHVYVARKGIDFGWVLARLGLTGAVSEPPERIEFKGTDELEAIFNKANYTIEDWNVGLREFPRYYISHRQPKHLITDETI